MAYLLVEDDIFTFVTAESLVVDLTMTDNTRDTDNAVLVAACIGMTYRGTHPSKPHPPGSICLFSKLWCLHFSATL